MEASTDFFISLIECNRIIYDKSSKDFKNVVKKEEAWGRIAKNSRMTVEAAKKRYASIRQKYCREKQKMELQKRTKSRPFQPWVFHDRLHFLDDYIRPRTTYTNDTGFQDIDDGSFPPRIDDASMSLAEETAVYEQLAAETEGQARELGNADGNIELSDGQERGGFNGPIVQYTEEDIQDRNSFRIVNDSVNPTVEVVYSDYSNEVSVFEPALQQTIDHEAGSNSQGTSTESVPHSSRSTRNDGLNENRVNVPSIVVRSVSAAKSNGNPTIPARPISKTVEPTATTMPTSKNDQSMELVRQKLDSCISSLSTKISEKQQRSPHAPFLTYLGTKLPNVAADDLPNLEKQILDLVASVSQ